MERNNSLFRKQNGQILVLSIMFLGILSTLMMGLFHISYAVRQKIRLQTSADIAILSALNCEANALNTIALTNRATLANDALAAQLIAFVSESSFYRKLAERFSRLLRFVPYAGPIGVFLARGLNTLEMILGRISSVVLPLACLCNKSLSVTRTGIRQVLPIHVITAAERTLELNMPQAEMTNSSRIALARQVRSLQKNLSDLDNQNMKKIRLATMDNHTMERNWRVSIAGISPVKKSGGTRLEGEDLVAWDKLKMKVISGLGMRWKTVLSAKSQARDLGYHSPKRMTTLLKENQGLMFSLGITVQSDLPDLSQGPPFNELKLTAVSAGTLVYKRPSKPEEPPNTFNSFWSATLMPVASESTLKKIIPAFILEEIRH